MAGLPPREHLFVDSFDSSNILAYNGSMSEVKRNQNVTYICRYHVVFCPKYRRKVLVPPIDTRLKEIIMEVVTKLRGEVIELEVMPDHVHLLLSCDPQFGIHRMVKHVKGVSSRLLRQEFPALKRRLPSLWTNTYFVATVGSVSLDVVKRYIESQKGV